MRREILLFRSRCMATAIFSGFLLIATVGHAALIDNLLVYYAFDGDATDSSVNGRDGTVEGGATFSAGKLGDALTVAGAGLQRVTYPSNGDLEPLNITVAGWVKLAANVSGIMMFADSSHGPGAGGFAFQIQNGNVPAIAYGNGSGFPEQYATTALALDTWYHIAGTVEQNGPMKIYVNGVEEGSLNYATRAQTLGQLNVGAIGGRELNGQIDDFGIWSRALSTDEIAGLYNNGDGAVIPEPSTMVLLILGLVGILGVRRRK